MEIEKLDKAMELRREIFITKDTRDNYLRIVMSSNPISEIVNHYLDSNIFEEININNFIVTELQKRIQELGNEVEQLEKEFSEL